jgi:hypothetical protein
MRRCLLRRARCAGGARLTAPGPRPRSPSSLLHSQHGLRGHAMAVAWPAQARRVQRGAPADEWRRSQAAASGFPFVEQSLDLSCRRACPESARACPANASGNCVGAAFTCRCCESALPCADIALAARAA